MRIELETFGLDCQLAPQSFRRLKVMAERELPGGIKATVLESHFGNQSKDMLQNNSLSPELFNLLPNLFALSPRSITTPKYPREPHRAILIASGITNAQLDRLVEKSDICRGLLAGKNTTYPGRVITVPWMQKREIPALQFAHVTDTLLHMNITDIDVYGYSYGGYYMGLLAEHIAKTSPINVHSLNLELSATRPGAGNAAFMEEYHRKVARLSQDYSDIHVVQQRLALMNQVPLSILPTYRLVNYFGISTVDPALDQEMATEYLKHLCESQGVRFQQHIFPASILSRHRIAEDRQYDVAELLNQSGVV